MLRIGTDHLVLFQVCVCGGGGGGGGGGERVERHVLKEYLHEQSRRRNNLHAKKL